MHAGSSAPACGVVIWSPDGRVLEANAAALELLGLRLDELRAATPFPWHLSLPDGTPVPDSERPFALALRSGRPQLSAVFKLHRPDGLERWAQIDAVPVLDAHGAVERVASTLLDVSSHSLPDQSPERSAQSFQDLFAGSAEPVLVYDLQTLGILAANAAACTFYGYTREELLSSAIGYLWPADGLARLQQDSATPRPFLKQSGECQHRHKDGRIFDVEIASHRLAFAGRDAVLLIVYDVTERREAQIALAQEHDFSASMLDTVDSLVLVCDAHGRIVHVNRTCELVTGYTIAEVRHRVFWDLLLPPEETEDAARQIQAVLRGDAGPLEFHCVAKDGSSRLISWSIKVVPNVAGGVAFLIASGTDVTEQRAVEAAMARLSGQHAKILASTGEGIFGFDRHGSTTFANPAAARMLGYAVDELVGHMHHALIHHSHADGQAYPRAYCKIYDALVDGGAHQVIDEVFWRKDGSSFPVEYTSTAIWEDGEISGAVVTFADVTERKLAEAASAHHASHDPLTGLPNRTRLRESLDETLSRATASNQPVALLVLDLDRFKEVNDTLGHHAGDLVLKQVGIRLQHALGATNIISRLGDDEFAIMLPGADAAAADYVGQLLAESLRSPFQVEGYAVGIGASIGIVVFPGHGHDTDTLLRHADVAMYAAKRTHIGQAFYDPADDQYNPHRLALLRDLRQMIEENQLVLYYQPKVGRTGTLQGVEALVRWMHPEQGMILPDNFIPLVEQTGLIGALTESVLDMALRQYQIWRAAGLHLPIAINLSAHSLHDGQFPQYVAAQLKRYDVPADDITMEITESSLMVDPVRALEILTELHDLGLRLAIDDFGTGYSSLGYLRDLPVDEVKVDKSFVRGMGPTTEAQASTKDAAIVRSVIAMAHELALDVVTEGVEHQHIWDTVADFGCDIIQGYYISRPLPPAELERWLRDAPPMAARRLDRRAP